MNKFKLITEAEHRQRTCRLKASPPAELGILFSRAVRLIAECAETDVYEVDLILTNISCNPAFKPLWAWAPDGIKAIILQSILASGLSRATRRQLR